MNDKIEHIWYGNKENKPDWSKKSNRERLAIAIKLTEEADHYVPDQYYEDMIYLLRTIDVDKNTDKAVDFIHGATSELLKKAYSMIGNLQAVNSEIREANTKMEDALETINTYIHILNEDDVHTRFKKIAAILKRSGRPGLGD